MKHKSCKVSWYKTNMRENYLHWLLMSGWMLANSDPQIYTTKLTNMVNDLTSNEWKMTKNGMYLLWDDSTQQPNLWWYPIQKVHWLKEDCPEDEGMILWIVDVQICLSSFQDLEWYSHLLNKASPSLRNDGVSSSSLVTVWRMTQKTATQNLKSDRIRTEWVEWWTITVGVTLQRVLTNLLPQTMNKSWITKNKIEITFWMKTSKVAKALVFISNAYWQKIMTNLRANKK